MAKFKRILTFVVIGMGVLGTVGVNLVAWRQVIAMTHFVEERDTAKGRTRPPEELNPIEKAQVIVTGTRVPRPRNTKTPKDFGLDYSRHELQTKRGDRLEAWMIQPANASTVFLLFHGYASSKASLLPLAEALVQQGYATFLVDFYGSGGSSGNSTSIGYYEALDVQAAHEYVIAQWPQQKTVFYGFSMGGAAVMRAVAVGNLQPDGAIVESTFDSLLNTVSIRFTAMELPPRPLADMLLVWGGIHWGFNPYRHNPADYARGVTVPTLVFYGEGDRRVIAEEAAAIYTALPGWKRYWLFPNGGHGLKVRHNPERWQQAISELMVKIEEQSRRQETEVRKQKGKG